MAASKETPKFEPTVTPPNGESVTLTQFYREFWRQDISLTERFNIIFVDLLQLRRDFEAHRVDGHPFTDRAGVVKEEIKLDARKAAVVAAFLTVIAAVAGLVSRWLGLPSL